MPQYMLLLHDNHEGRAGLSPEQMQQTLQKYMDWTKHSVLHRRLGNDPGKVIRSKGGQTHTTDGPYSETKEVMGGIYLIEAKDYDEAVERTLDHPHLAHGTIELRQLYT